MDGYRGRASRAARASRHFPRRRQTARRGRVQAGSARRRGAWRTGTGASRSGTRRSRTRQGVHGHRTPPPPPLPAAQLLEPEPRGDLSAPSPDVFLPPSLGGTAANPVLNPPAAAASRPHTEEGATTAVAPSPLAPERQSQGGGGRVGGQPAGSPAREGGGSGGATANPRHTAAPQPRASGRCTPDRQGSPPKRGRGAAGASTPSKACASGHQRPAAARGLFDLGFTRSTAVMPSGDEEMGGGSAPPRGAEAPGTGHGRASSEDT